MCFLYLSDFLVEWKPVSLATEVSNIVRVSFSYFDQYYLKEFEL